MWMQASISRIDHKSNQTSVNDFPFTQRINWMHFDKFYIECVAVLSSIFLFVASNDYFWNGCPLRVCCKVVHFGLYCMFQICVFRCHFEKKRRRRLKMFTWKNWKKLSWLKWYDLVGNHWIEQMEYSEHFFFSSPLTMIGLFHFWLAYLKNTRESKRNVKIDNVAPEPNGKGE